MRWRRVGYLCGFRPEADRLQLRERLKPGAKPTAALGAFVSLGSLRREAEKPMQLRLRRRLAIAAAWDDGALSKLVGRRQECAVFLLAEGERDQERHQRTAADRYRNK